MRSGRLKEWDDEGNGHSGGADVPSGNATATRFELSAASIRIRALILVKRQTAAAIPG
jgi:hypothetical protein